MYTENFVSIIIPAYNAEKTIKRTIESVIKQSYKGIEIIVVDDGSKDNTLGIVKSLLKGENAKVITQGNLGVSAARNKGIEVATGKYICFLDADDFYNSDFLKKMVSEIENKDLDLCFCGYSSIRNKKNYKYKFNYLSSIMNGEEVCCLHLKGNINLWIGALILKSDIIKNNKLRFSIDIQYGEDQEFIIKYLINSKRIGCVNEELINYVFVNKSATNSFSEKRFSGLKAFKNLESELRKYTNIRLIELINKRIAEEFYWIAISFGNCTSYEKKINEYCKRNDYISSYLQYKDALSIKKRAYIKLFIKYPVVFYYYIHIKKCTKKFVKNILNIMK